MSPVRSKVFVVAAMLGLIALPVAQWWGDRAAGRPAAWVQLFERPPTAAHLRAVEQAWQEAAARNAYLRGLAAAPGLAWLRSAEGPVLTVRGSVNQPDGTWLFYRPDVRLLSQRPPAGSVERAAAATIHWRDQLASRGVRLIVVVAPNKAAVQRPGAFEVEEVWKSPELRRYQEALTANRVEFVDLHAAFAAAPVDLRRKAPLYLPRDTHWSKAGLDLAAAAIVERLGWPQRADVYRGREVSVPHVGDLERWLGSAPSGRQEMVWKVTDDQGNPPAAKSGGAEVLLLGDSFCRIFEDGAVVGGGLKSQLAWRLGRPVGQLRQDGGGATLVRQDLVRRPEWLQGLKVVVWEFAERDLTSPETEWAQVVLPR